MHDQQHPGFARHLPAREAGAARTQHARASSATQIQAVDNATQRCPSSECRRTGRVRAPCKGPRQRIGIRRRCVARVRHHHRGAAVRAANKTLLASLLCLVVLLVLLHLRHSA